MGVGRFRDFVEQVRAATNIVDVVGEDIIKGLRDKAQTDIALEAEKAQLALRDSVVQMAILASEKVIGVHLLADHADTLIGEAVMMVSGNMTLEQVGNAIHPHPTLSEMMHESVLDAYGRAIHF